MKGFRFNRRGGGAGRVGQSKLKIKNGLAQAARNAAGSFLLVVDK